MTAALITCDNLYVEHCINHACPDWISIPLGIIAIVVNILYLKHTVNLLIKYMNL